MNSNSKLANDLRRFLHEEPASARDFFHQLRAAERPFLLRSDVQDILAGFCASDGAPAAEESPLVQALDIAQEVTIEPNWIYLALRRRPASWAYLRIHLETLAVEAVDVAGYLACKERLVDGARADEDWTLEIDLEPFSRHLAKLKEAKSIGRGVEFLNRRL